MITLRQGDVALHKVKEIPDGFEKQLEPRLRIKGEQGHHHQFVGLTALWLAQQRQVTTPPGSENLVAVIEVTVGAKVEHNQHPPLEIPEGKWEVLQGKEHENPQTVD